MRHILRACGPAGLMALLAPGLAPDARADSEPDPEPAVIALWSIGAISVTSSVAFDIRLQLRIEHGDDDWFLDQGPYRVGPVDSVLAAPTWPDVSTLGDELVAPGLVTGFVRVYALDGSDLGSLSLPPQLVFLDDPTVTYDPSDLLALLPTTVQVGAGEALAGIAPEAVVTAALQEGTP